MVVGSGKKWWATDLCNPVFNLVRQQHFIWLIPEKMERGCNGLLPLGKYIYVFFQVVIIIFILIVTVYTWVTVDFVYKMNGILLGKPEIVPDPNIGWATQVIGRLAKLPIHILKYIWFHHYVVYIVTSIMFCVLLPPLCCVMTVQLKLLQNLLVW